MKTTAAVTGVVCAVVLLPMSSSPGRAQCWLQTTFDPRAATSLVSYGEIPYSVWADFRSPESANLSQVWYCGEPATMNGSVGGARFGSDRPTGKLEIQMGEITCFGVMSSHPCPIRRSSSTRTGSSSFRSSHRVQRTSCRRTGFGSAIASS